MVIRQYAIAQRRFRMQAVVAMKSTLSKLYTLAYKLASIIVIQKQGKFLR